MIRKQQNILLPAKPKKQKIIQDGNLNVHILDSGRAHVVSPLHIFDGIFLFVLEGLVFAFESRQSPVFAYKLLRRFRFDVFFLDRHKALPKAWVQNFADALAEILDPPPGLSHAEIIQEFLNLRLVDNQQYRILKKNILDDFIRSIPEINLHESEAKQINHLSPRSEFLYKVFRNRIEVEKISNMVKALPTPIGFPIIILLILIVVVAVIGIAAYAYQEGLISLPGIPGISDDKQDITATHTPQQVRAMLDRGEITLNDIPPQMRPGILAMGEQEVVVNPGGEPSFNPIESFFDPPDNLLNPGGGTPDPEPEPEPEPVAPTLPTITPIGEPEP